MLIIVCILPREILSSALVREFLTIFAPVACTMQVFVEPDIAGGNIEHGPRLRRATVRPRPQVTRNLAQLVLLTLSGLEVYLGSLLWP
jgi:hypothetical protein